MYDSVFIQGSHALSLVATNTYVNRIASFYAEKITLQARGIKKIAFRISHFSYGLSESRCFSLILQDSHGE